MDAACTALRHDPDAADGGRRRRLAGARCARPSSWPNASPRARAFRIPATCPSRCPDLPVADVEAFSIDDVTTTEIDDALSVTELDGGKLRVGIHIAAPALGIKRGEALDAIARQRLSTVYFPGDKITMLPDPIVERYTLQEGRTCPALLAVCDGGPEHAGRHRHHRQRDPRRAGADRRQPAPQPARGRGDRGPLANGTGDYPFRTALTHLFHLANHLHDERQRARLASGLRPESHNRADYNFYIDQLEGGAERVRIEQRRRGSRWTRPWPS